jgi:hypothetical protein
MSVSKIRTWLRQLASERQSLKDSDCHLEVESLEGRMMLSSAPTAWVNPIGVPIEGSVTITGTSVDDVEVDRNRLSLKNEDTQQFWDGSQWNDEWALFQPDGTEENWSYTVDLDAGNYRVGARTWDNSNNRDVASRPFSVAEDQDPAVGINPIGTPMEGTITFSGTSVDDVEVDRNRLSLSNLDTQQFWNGSQWSDQWAMFEPDGAEDWSYTVDLDAGNYRLVARTWDTAGQRDVTSQLFSVSEDETPEVGINPIGTPMEGTITFSGTSADDVEVDRNRLSLSNVDTQQFWNGSQWSNQWAMFEPDGAEDWSYTVDLEAGNYRLVARTWDTAGQRDVTSQLFSVFDPDDLSNEIVASLNEVLPDGWTLETRIQNNDIWFRTVDPSGNDQIDIRFGSAGVIAEIRDVATGRSLLAPSYQGESTDRVIQWTLWETGQTVRHDVPSLPDFEDRFNTTQAGTFDNVLNGIVDVDLNSDEGQIDVWSVVDNNWKSEQDPYMDGTVTALTRTEILDGGAILIRRVVRIGEINLHGQATTLDRPYFEAWNPLSDSAFDSLALSIDANGNPNVWYADGYNIPYYSNTSVANTRGWATSYDRDNINNGTNLSIVYGTDKGTLHLANGSERPNNHYNLNLFDFSGGMAILPGLYTGSLSEGAIIDQHIILLPGEGIDSSTAAQLDALSQRLPPPQVYQAGAEIEGELFAIADRLSNLQDEPRVATDHIAPLL